MAEPATRTLSDLKDLARPSRPSRRSRRRRPKLDGQGRAYATGRRKDAVARVWVKPGAGRVTVNGRDIETYFARPVLRMIINQPFVVASRVQQFDVVCTVAGGGLSGQAGAVRHGISRALIAYDPNLRAAAQGGRLPDPRLAPGRAQEVRQAQGPPQLPVLQALSPQRPRRLRGPSALRLGVDRRGRVAGVDAGRRLFRDRAPEGAPRDRGRSARNRGSRPARSPGSPGRPADGRARRRHRMPRSWRRR